MNSLYRSDSLLEQLTTAVVAVDHNNRVRSINASGERLFGTTRRYLMGRPLDEILPGHPVALELVERARQQLMVCHIHQVSLSVAPGNHKEVSLTTTPLIHSESTGEPPGILLQLEETRDTQRLEEDERRVATLDSLGNLALTTAHEVKNPLAGIRGAAQLLEMEIGGEGRDYCQLIRSEVDRITHLLDTLLGFADTAPLANQSLNIHEVLDQVVMLQNTPSTPISRDYDPSLPEIKGDRERLVQVFINLIKNAVESSSPGHPVKVNSRMDRQVRRVQGKRRSSVMVEVINQGPELSAQLLKQIFQPFFSTKSQGSGLGLPISQKIIHEHGGTIEVKSRNRQTIFRVFLPTQPPLPPEPNHR